MGVTHEVFNQTPPLVDYDMAGADPLLLAALEREGAGWARDQVEALGRRMSTEEVYGWASPPTRTSPSCAPTTGSATAPTPSSSTRRGTTSWTWPSPTGSIPCPGRRHRARGASPPAPR